MNRGGGARIGKGPRKRAQGTTLAGEGETDTMRIPTAALTLGLIVATSNAWSVPRRVVRDRFRGTVAVGLSTGVGSPLGFAGVFAEWRPWRQLGVSGGAGFGGLFGPSVAGTVTVSPIGTRGWSLGVSGSLSHQFGYLGAMSVGTRSLPTSSDWGSVGVVSEWRPSRGFMVRVGGGRAFLLNPGDFAVLQASEVEPVAQRAPSIPGYSPVDAVLDASQGRDVGVWYVHLDLGFVWGL